MRPGDGRAEAFLAALQAGRGPSLEWPVAVVMAHPDDETVGLGAQLPAMRNLSIVTVTDGAPRNLQDARAYGFATESDYAAARQRELRAALALAGIGEDRILSLTRPDQEASLEMAGLARRLVEVLADCTIVVTHPYEGGHPDHDATAFGVHAARALLTRAGRPAPDIVEATSYHLRGGRLVSGEFLPGGGPGGGEPAIFRLSDAQRALKARMVACFESQRAMLAQFTMDRELLRPAPACRFTAPPHPGMLFYEMFDWGMQGARWRELAAAALEALGLEEPL